MMKVKISNARVHVTGRFKREGSVLRETIDAQGVGFDTKLDVESDAPAERVAAVIRNAEDGCYVMQAILKPTPVVRLFTLNGSNFDPRKQ